MKKFSRIMSALLAVLMMMGTVTVATSAAIPLLPTKESPDIMDYEDTIDVYLGETTGLNNPDNAKKQVKYNTPQEKLAGMSDKPIWENHGYQLWIDEVTGEVATVKVATGEILFTNPWNTQEASYTNGSNKKTTSLAIKKQLLSQLVINYVDNDTDKVMYSAIEAAARDQINVEYITDGIRVEYSIGREDTRMLVPKLIKCERFEQKILKPMREYFNEDANVIISDGHQKDENGKTVLKNTDLWNNPSLELGKAYPHYDLVAMHNPSFEWDGELDLKYDNFEVKKVAAYYTRKDTERAGSDRERSEIEAAFPITKKMAVYVFDPAASTVEQMQVERRIKDYVPSFTYEELDAAHEETEYVGTDKPPALFKMALEYTLDENGMSVRLPANGIRFDQSLYQLEGIEMLPYMGAGSNDGDFNDGGDGYTFFPDGSGTLFDFEQLNTGSNKTINGKVYGQDYAYHEITGTHQEIIRYPAFGIVEKWTGNKTVTDYDNVIKEATYDSNGKELTPAEYGTKNELVNEDHGFLAIIEEGDALAELSTFHMSATSIYNTVRMIFYPRPKDSYNMADALSVGSNTKMTVVSNRKYVGSYKVRYIMLSDDKLAAENKLSSYYEASWMGMAVAYRDYLEATNVLDRLTEADVDDDIPLYIETFGALWTTEKILSIPVDVMTPLTSFEDVKTMYAELSTAIEAAMKEKVEDKDNIGSTEETIKDFSNLNFKLTGYANGGMYSTVPGNLNWEAAVGGASGFQDLVDYSKQEGFDVFPDFDFVYINSTDTLDGVELKTDAVKTIDNRYTGRREYSATMQTYQGYFGLAIAPSCFEKFITKLAVNYLKYNPTGISVSTLGTDLNSDFDEEDPLNREDSKKYTIDALKQLTTLRNEEGNALKVMTDGGNAYSWRYVDYIVNMPLNSSRYNISSNAVPFIGVVLHGYLQFAGTPINEEGDIEYAFLKAIENGAGLYFTLSYQNTQKLKEYTDLSQYFSVRYDIWKDDVVDMYVELNNLLCDLQTKLIIDHDFLIGDRIPGETEAEDDQEDIQKAEDLKEAADTIEEIKQALKDALALRHTPTESVEMIESALTNANEQIKTLGKYIAKIDGAYVTDCANTIRQVKAAEAAVAAAKKTVFNAAAHEAALKETESFIRSNLIILAVAESDKLADGASDAVKAVIADAQKKLIEKAIDVATVEAVDVAVNNIDKTYASTAEENADAKINAEQLINEVAVQIDALGNEIVNAAADKAAAEKAVAAVKNGIIAGLSSGIATESFATGKTAYNKSVSEVEGRLNTAVDSYLSLEQLKAEAIEMGITATDLNNAIALNKALSVVNAKLDAIDTITSNFARKIDAVRTAINAYYNNVKNIVDKADLKDAQGQAISNQLKSDLKSLVLLYQNTALYEVYAVTEVAGLAQDPYAANRETSLASVNSAKSTIDALTPERKAAAEAMWATIEAQLNDYLNDASALYEQLVAETNKYYDDVEKVYVEYAREDIVEAVKLITNSNRCSELNSIAKSFVTANGSFAADKAYANAVKVYNANNDLVNLIDSTTKKRANNAITNGAKDNAVTAYDRSAYTELKLYMDTTATMRDLSIVKAEYAGMVSEYAANIVLVAGLEAEKAVAQDAISTEALMAAKAAADAVFKDKASAYNAKAPADEQSSVITKLIDAVNDAQATYDIAAAAYKIAADIALPHPNATEAEIKAYSTSAEIKDYNRKLESLTAASNLLDAAKQALNDVINASACKTELEELIAAYNAQIKAQKDLLKITAVNKAVDALVIADSNFAVDAATEALLNDAKAAALKRFELANAIESSNSYKSYITSATNAFSAIAGYLASAERDLNSAKIATEALKNRVEQTKLDKEAADWTANVYEIAVTVATYTPSELKTLSEKSEEGTVKDLFTKAYAVATTDIATLQANAEAADAKSEAALLFEAAKANEKHSSAGLVELNESYQYKKVTAEREMNNAQQFYEIAVSETQQAQAKYDELKALYDQWADKYNSYEILGSSVLLFGDSTIESIKSSTIGDMKIANDLYDAIIASIELVSNEWAKINAATTEYKAAKAAYEALLAVDLSTLSDAEKSENRSQLVYYSYKLMSAETTINDAKQAIDTEHLTKFKDNYSQLTKLIETVFSREAQAKNHYESAEILYNMVKDDAAISADIKNDAKTAYENAKAFYELIEANNDKFTADDGSESPFDKLCKKAYEELGLLTVKDENAEDLEFAIPATVTKLTDYVNELFGNVKVTVEEKEDTKYTCDDGSIVAVTYGGKDGKDDSAYRTFLLNFNSFKVTVNYNGTDYEIDQYGYVVINHN